MATWLLQPLASVKPSKPCPLSSPRSEGLAHPPCYRVSPLVTGGRSQLSSIFSLSMRGHLGAEIVMVLPGLLRSGYLLGLAQGGGKTTSSQSPSHELKQTKKWNTPTLGIPPHCSPRLLLKWRDGVPCDSLPDSHDSLLTPLSIQVRKGTCISPFWIPEISLPALASRLKLNDW